MKTLVWDNYHEDSVAWLKAHKGIRLCAATDPKEEIEALLVRSQTLVDEALLKLYPRLKIVITATSGFDHIQWPACQVRGVVAAFCPNSNADSAAEHTLFLMLSLLKNAKDQFANLRSGQWRVGLHRGALLKGKTVGVIGLGRIGSRVAKLVQAFGATVIAHDPYQEDAVFHNLKVPRLGMVEVFREADILTLHVPYTKQTRHLISKSTLEEIPDHALIINASRGNVIEESDLVTALRQKRLRAVAMDVFAKEPMEATSFLLKEKNLIATPHTGAFTEEAWAHSSMEAAQKLVSFANGEVISDTLPLNVPWFKDNLL